MGRIRRHTPTDTFPPPSSAHTQTEAPSSAQIATTSSSRTSPAPTTSRSEMTPTSEAATASSPACPPSVTTRSPWRLNVSCSSSSMRAVFAVAIVAVIIAATLMKAAEANPVFVDNPSLAQFQSGRNIRHLPCIVRKSGRSGVCMFAIDCIKQNGTHLGTCIDRFYFGSCCQLKDDTALYAPEINDNSIDQNTISHFAHESTTLPTSALFKLTTETTQTHGSNHPAAASISEAIRNVTQSYSSNKGSAPKPVNSTSVVTTTTSVSHHEKRPPLRRPPSSQFVVRTTAKPTVAPTTVKPPRRKTTAVRPHLTTEGPLEVLQHRVETTTVPSKFFTFQIVETTTPTATESARPAEVATTVRPAYTRRPKPTRTSTTMRPSPATPVEVANVSPTSEKGSTPVKDTTPSKDTTHPVKNTTPVKDTTPVRDTTPMKDTTPVRNTSRPKPSQSTRRPTTASSTKKPPQTHRPSGKPSRRPVTTEGPVDRIAVSTGDDAGHTTQQALKPGTTTINQNEEVGTTLSDTKPPHTTLAPRPRPKPTAAIVKVPKPTRGATTSSSSLSSSSSAKPTKKTPTTSQSTSSSTTPATPTKQRPSTEAPPSPRPTSTTTMTTTTRTTTTRRPTKTTTRKPTTTTPTTTSTTTTTTARTTASPAATESTTIKPGLVTWTNLDSEPVTNATVGDLWQPRPPAADWVPVPPMASNKTDSVPQEGNHSGEGVPPMSAATEKIIVSVSSSISSSMTNGSSSSSHGKPERPQNSPSLVAASSPASLPSKPSKPKPVKTTAAPAPISSTTLAASPSTTSTSSTTTTTTTTTTTAKPTTTTTTTTTEAPAVTEEAEEEVSEEVEEQESSTASVDESTEGIFGGTGTGSTTPEYTTEDYNATTGTGSTTTAPVNSLEGMDYRQICGRRMFPEPRIVGGANAAFGRWPWQISLRQWRTSTYLHKCGAALLNENWAITAAHCVDNVPPSDLLLRLGEYDLAEEEEPYGYQERRVQIVASHPQFDPRTFEYDLALLRFYEPVTFQPNIIPVCVPNSDENFIGQTAFVTGWGRLYEDGPLPSVLQEVAVPVINNTICESMYRSAGYIEHIPHIFICAGWKKGGYDSCEGDSGGPMVLQREEDKRFQLGGVISWGIGCAEVNQPGVYTRISEFRDWINQILQF